MRGFQLIELLTVVALVAILAALSFPLYTQYLVQARRLEAKTELTKLALAMETYHMAHDTFEGSSLTKLKFPQYVANNHYRLQILTATSSHFLIAAKPRGHQAKRDHQCGSLIIGANGEKRITGTGDISECW